GDNFQFEPGRAIEMRQGRDVTIIACGIMVAPALEAAELLAAEGIRAGVLNIHTLKPLDVQAIVAAARDTGAIVTAEEHSIIGGLGSAVAETLAEHYPVRMRRVGLRDVFGESGKPDELLQKYGLTSSGLVDAVRSLL
ncbi:MAG: transketolase family protein, partial [Candidatus Desulforudis sp.]|nr:transketolase family protein [Desulforudis sp.]